MTAWLKSDHPLRACFPSHLSWVFFQWEALPGLLCQVGAQSHSVLLITTDSFLYPVLQAGGPEKVAGLPDVPFQMDALLLFPLRSLDVVRQKNKTKNKRPLGSSNLHSRHFFLAFPPLTQSDRASSKPSLLYNVLIGEQSAMGFLSFLLPLYDLRCRGSPHCFILFLKCF